MPNSNPANERIRSFVVEKFPLARKRNIKDSDELLESGMVDSLGVLDLVHFLEQEFSITVVDDELIPENFRTVEKIAAFVKSRTAPNA